MMLNALNFAHIRLWRRPSQLVALQLVLVADVFGKGRLHLQGQQSADNGSGRPQEIHRVGESITR